MPLLVLLTFALTGGPGDPSETIARSIVADLAARKLDAVVARFDSTVAAALPKDKLAATWDGLVAHVGAFQRIESATVQPSGPSAKLTTVVLTCAFDKARFDIQVTLDGKQHIAGLFFRPAPAPWSPPPYATGPVRETEVKIAGLPGTLTLPATGDGPFPAVVLIHGSGPHDRDGTVYGTKVFADLARGLAARGIASLRYDKRTKVEPQAFAPTVRYTVMEEVVNDAREAVRLLHKTPKIDTLRIYAVGHSLGGWLAPRIMRPSSGEPRLAGLVILAGSTRPLEVLLREQIQVTSPGNAEIASAVEAFAKRVADPALKPDDVVDMLGAKLPGSYFLDLRSYDVVSTARAVAIPILALQGGRDYQVRAADLDGWKRAGATTKVYPALNHLFVAGSGPSTPAEYLQAGHVAEEVVADIAAFVAGQKGR
jgi:hypothetical protein